MKNIVIFTIGLIVFISCDKEENIDRKIPDGTYTGTFQRKCVWADSDTANITMIFSLKNWNGTSEFEKYPALRYGTYSIVGDTIIFLSGGAFSADFDWSLILQGKYLLKQTENVIEFTKDYRSATNDTYFDQYIITKQE